MNDDIKKIISLLEKIKKTLLLVFVLIGFFALLYFFLLINLIK